MRFLGIVCHRFAVPAPICERVGQALPLQRIAIHRIFLDQAAEGPPVFASFEGRTRNVAAVLAQHFPNVVLLEGLDRLLAGDLFGFRSVKANFQTVGCSGGDLAG